MVEYLTLEDALSLIEDLAVGPVRDLGLLDSALHRPATMLWGRDAYATIDEKAAALLDSLVRNHPLVDGNKRLGWLATLVFLDINGHWVEAPDDDAYRLVMDVAAGKLSLKEITAALSQWHGRGSESSSTVGHGVGLSAWTRTATAGEFHRGRGHSTRPGTFPSGRGHSAPSGTGFLSPNAQGVPDRERMHPHAQKVPVEIGRPALMSIQCRTVPNSARPAPRQCRAVPGRHQRSLPNARPSTRPASIQRSGRRPQ